MFSTPRLRRFEIPENRMFATLGLRRFKIPENRMFATLRLHRSKISENLMFVTLKTYLKNFVKLDVSRVTGFPEFPNTRPSGKRVDSDDPIPRTFRKFSKKRHPRNVGGDTCHPETLQRSNRGRFRGTTPLSPITRRLPLLNFFTALLF
jgi:hypothetical protein